MLSSVITFWQSAAQESVAQIALVNLLNQAHAQGFVKGAAQVAVAVSQLLLQVCQFMRRVALSGQGQPFSRRPAQLQLKFVYYAGQKALQATARMRVDDEAAADRLGRRRITQDKAIAAGDGLGVAQADLQPAILAGRQGVGIQQADVGDGLGGAAEKLDLGIVLQRTVDVAELAEVSIREQGGLELPRMSQQVAALYIAAVDTGDIDRDPAAGGRGFYVTPVTLQPSDAAGAAGWLQLDIVAEGQRAAGKRAGNHGAEAADREDPVDRQAGLIIIDAQRQPGQGVLKRGQELVDAGASVSGKRDQRQLAQLRFCKQFRDLQLDQIEPFRVVNQIDLADDDN